MTANDTAKTVAVALGRSPYSKGASRLQADLEKPVTHTPGPWDQRGCHFNILGPKHEIICKPYPGTFANGTSEDEALANAKLIAAAPALLEACKLALAESETIGATTDRDSHIRYVLRAALTLATGGAK